MKRKIKQGEPVRVVQRQLFDNHLYLKEGILDSIFGERCLVSIDNVQYVLAQADLERT